MIHGLHKKTEGYATDFFNYSNMKKKYHKKRKKKKNSLQKKKKYSGVVRLALGVCNYDGQFL